MRHPTPPHTNTVPLPPQPPQARTRVNYVLPDLPDIVGNWNSVYSIKIPFFSKDPPLVFEHSKTENWLKGVGWGGGGDLKKVGYHLNKQKTYIYCRKIWVSL